MRDGVDVDPQGSTFGQEGRSEIGAACLGKSIHALAKIGARGPSRTEIDDLAVAAIDHPPTKDLAAKKCSLRMNVKNPVPVLFSHFQRRFRKAKARAVHQNQAEIPPLDKFQNSMFQQTYVIDLADVRTYGVRSPACGFHRALGLQKFFAASTHQNNFSARARVDQSEGAPNPLACSSDDRP